MDIICIQENKNITLYKKYKVLIELDDHYGIVDDKNNFRYYNNVLFREVNNHRNILFKKILKNK